MSLNDLRNIFLLLVAIGLFLITTYLGYEEIFKPYSSYNPEQAGIRAVAKSFFAFTISGVSLILLFILMVLYFQKRERIFLISMIFSILTLTITLIEIIR